MNRRHRLRAQSPDALATELETVTATYRRTGSVDAACRAVAICERLDALRFTGWADMAAGWRDELTWCSRTS